MTRAVLHVCASCWRPGQMSEIETTDHLQGERVIRCLLKDEQTVAQTAHQHTCADDKRGGVMTMPRYFIYMLASGWSTHMVPTVHGLTTACGRLPCARTSSVECSVPLQGPFIQSENVWGQFSAGCYGTQWAVTARQKCVVVYWVS